MGKDKNKNIGFADFISSEIEEIEKYVKDNPEMERDVAIKQWIKRHAKEFRDKYESH